MAHCGEFSGARAPSAAAMEGHMTSRSERIELLSEELLTAALAATTDLATARTRAARALDRILERDPGLARLGEILSALHRAADACAANRTGPAWRRQAEAFA
jgi:predicted secreted protein